MNIVSKKLLTEKVFIIASSFAQILDTSKELWLNMEESYQHRKLEAEHAKKDNLHLFLYFSPKILIFVPIYYKLD